jgi:probable phosphoglycerate mutase
MPILLLIRHATNDFVKTGRLPGHTLGIHLNEEGRAQAAALGKLLSYRNLHAVYASHLERAIETALHIASHHKLAVQIRPALADIDNGDLTGMEIKKLGEDEATKALWKIVVDKPSAAAFPNGEAMLDMQARVVAALDAIARAHPDLEFEDSAKPDGPDAKPTKRTETQTVAVVAHADVIKAALAHFLGMPFDNFQRLGTAPASISTVIVVPAEGEKPGSVMVQSVNQIS